MCVRIFQENRIRIMQTSTSGNDNLWCHNLVNNNNFLHLDSSDSYLSVITCPDEETIRHTKLHAFLRVDFIPLYTAEDN